MAEAPPEFEETTTEVIKAGYLYKQGLLSRFAYKQLHLRK